MATKHKHGKRCKQLFWVGLGEERHCNKEAVYLVNKNYPGDCYPVCAECAKNVHPLRLTKLEASDAKPNRLKPGTSAFTMLRRGWSLITPDNQF